MRFVSICLVLAPLVAAVMAVPCPLFCNCGLTSGEDVCSNKKGNCQPLVVRPMEIPKPVLPVPKTVTSLVGAIPPLVPIAGPCSCNAALVKPAVLPKPACSVCSARVTTTNNQCNANQYASQAYYNPYAPAPLPAYAPAPLPAYAPYPANPANYAPADAVSLQLAYKMSQEACNQNEDRLAFGFRVIPKDIPIIRRKATSNVPEGDLYNLNGQIVELKKIACGNKKSLDEEAIEELIAAADEEEQLGEAEQFKKVSLGEIGYKPAQIKSGAFVSVSGGAGLDVEDTIAAASLKPCNDGYKPGQVVITQVPVPSPVQFPIPLPEPCGSEEEPVIPPVPSFPYGFSSPYTYVSQSQSSKSSCANKISSVVLQKLGCN